MNKDNKDKLLAIFLVLLAIVVVLISSLNKKGETKEENISIVTNYSDFFTVDSCLYRTITYINTKDYDSLNLVVDENYKKKNNVSDVSKLFHGIPDNATFVSEKMYYSNLSKDVTKYYVKGYAESDVLNEYGSRLNKERENLYFIVYLDSKSLLFSVEPYDGALFMEVDKDE